MIIDSHAHFEPRLLNKSHMIAEMDRNKVDKMVLIPHLTNPPESVKPGILMNVQRKMFNSDLLRPLAIKITKSMYNSENEWDLKFLKFFMKTSAEKLEIVQEPDNSIIADMTQQSDRFLGWIFVNPRKKATLEDLEKYVSLDGMIGIKIHPFWHRFDMPEAAGIFEFARKHKLPVNIHLGFDGSGDYKWALENFPDVKIVFAHLGVPYYKRLWLDTKHYENVYMDISSTYHVDESLLKEAVSLFGPERIFFATDTPYTKAGSMATLIKWVENLSISPAQKEGIFYKNFIKLIDHL